MTSEEGGVGIGARLRAARERRGLTLLQAAEKLHVDARVLEGLEAENFEPLGAAVYVRGHLRRYAELIGEAPGELQDLYANSGTAARPDLTRIPRGERTPAASPLLLPALLGLIAVALAGLIWWILNLPRAHPVAVPAAPPAALSAAPAPAPAEGADTAAEPAPPATATQVAAVAPAVPAPAAGAPTLLLRFSGASWVQVADGHGKVLIDGLQAAGGTRTVSGAAPLYVVLGNAPAVALEVNGRPATLDGLVRRRGDAHFTVDAAGAVAAPPAARD